ncbi:hypothetical protein LQ51_02910 [Micromonospora sp. HK10]|nr:hypothetical protein LQ51_02910 [Micromonospora sp. HK10]
MTRRRSRSRFRRPIRWPPGPCGRVSAGGPAGRRARAAAPARRARTVAACSGAARRGCRRPPAPGPVRPGG